MSSCQLERQPDAECLRGMNRSLHFSRLLTAIWHWYWMSALLILSLMVVYVGTPGSYAFLSIPVLSLHIKNHCHLRFKTPLLCLFLLYMKPSAVWQLWPLFWRGRGKMRGTKPSISNSKATMKNGNQASKQASPALISAQTMHRIPFFSVQLQENTHYESHSSSPWPAAAAVVHVQGASSAHAQWDHLQWSSCPEEGLGHRTLQLRQRLSVVGQCTVACLTSQLQ